MSVTATTSSNNIASNSNSISTSNKASPTLVHRKIAILGFRAVGKSSLTNSFVTGTFSEAYDPTIESTLHKTIRFRKVHFATDIVDTAGMVRKILFPPFLTYSLFGLTHKIKCIDFLAVFETFRMNSPDCHEMLA